MHSYCVINLMYAILAVVVLAAGCGGDAPDTGTDTDTDTPPADTDTDTDTPPADQAQLDLDAWIAAESRPLTSVTLGDGGDDLDHLLGQLGDGLQILGLGEGSHGTTEHTQVRTRITWEMVQERGTRLILLEDDAFQVDAIARYANGEVDNLNAFNGFAFNTCGGMSTLWTAIREHNSVNPDDRIMILGVDAQLVLGVPFEQTEAWQFLQARSAGDAELEPALDAFGAAYDAQGALLLDALLGGAVDYPTVITLQAQLVEAAETFSDVYARALLATESDPAVLFVEQHYLQSLRLSSGSGLAFYNLIALVITSTLDDVTTALTAAGLDPQSAIEDAFQFRPRAVAQLSADAAAFTAASGPAVLLMHNVHIGQHDLLAETYAPGVFAEQLLGVGGLLRQALGASGYYGVQAHTRRGTFTAYSSADRRVVDVPWPAVTPAHFTELFPVDALPLLVPFRPAGAAPELPALLTTPWLVFAGTGTVPSADPITYIDIVTIEQSTPAEADAAIIFDDTSGFIADNDPGCSL